jgi:hypothetical protein
VLAGENEQLISTFVFDTAPQGHAYWWALYESRDPLPPEAQAALREWIARAEAGEQIGSAEETSTAQSDALPSGFLAEDAREVLAGNNRALIGAFVFGSTPQGHAYWWALYESDDPLPEEAQAILRGWIARAEAGEQAPD